mmetsp:Transcript_103603/g.182587  ORF Transcript_103603/g.182587 Transcript_103603/m.182587 type:complete len:231 (+) Transcript_103603:98-790(+)
MTDFLEQDQRGNASTGSQDAPTMPSKKSSSGWDDLSATSTTSGMDSAPTTPIERYRVVRLNSTSTTSGADSAPTTPMPGVSDSYESFQSTTSSFCSESSMEFATPASVPISKPAQAAGFSEHRALPPSLRQCARSCGITEIPLSHLLQRRRSLQQENNAERVTPRLTVDLQLLPQSKYKPAAKPAYNAIVTPCWSSSSSIWWRRQAAVCVDGEWQSVAGLALAGARCEKV